MAYFNSLNLHSSATLTGDDTISFNFVSMEPSWEQAFVGQTQSGRETVIVPVPDSLLKFLNQGRSGAKLLFSKISPDTIFANLLVYLADSAYYQDNNHLLDFNTFTGLYVLLDIEQRFITGVRMHGGIPVGRVKSLSRQSSPNPEDRDDTFDEDCITYFESILAPCPPQAFTECYDVTIVETEDCDGPGSGGGGGSGTTTGGSGNGGGTSTGGGTGGTTNPPTTPTYWDVFSGQIPIELFTGALPPGFDLQLFQQLVDIVKAHHFSVEQVKWLMDHTGFIPVIWNASGPNQVGEEMSMIKPVLNFAMSNFNSAELYNYLIYHPSVFQQIVNSPNPAQEFHNHLLSSNLEYNALNTHFTTATAWFWPIVQELGIELLVAVLEKQGGKAVQLPINCIQALKAIAQADLYEFFDEAKDILAQFNIHLKVFDALWDVGELGWKANKIIQKVENFVEKLGEQATEKLWAAMNKNLNVLQNLDVNDWPYGIKLNGKSVQEFWDDLVESFAPSNIIEYTSAGQPAKRFTELGVDVAYYWSSSGYWTITFNGNEFKFRF